MASYRGGLLIMSMTINQIIFDLILRKDEKSIQELLNKGLATKEIVEEERKSYEKIYEEKIFFNNLINKKFYKVFFHGNKIFFGTWNNLTGRFENGKEFVDYKIVDKIEARFK